MEDRVTKGHARDILEKGFVVCDGVFGEKRATTMRNEVQHLARRGKMIANRVKFGTSLLTKPNIFEADMHDDSLRSETSEFDKLFRSNWIAERLKILLPDLGILTGQSDVTIKLQWNRGGGGCFPFHYDNPGRPNRRFLTCLLYLNPHWREGDGGELELLPFLERAVKIAPVHDRMVVFRSDRVLHRVLPARRERFCFTVWIDSSRANSDEDVFLKAKHLQLSSVDYLKSSPLQRVLSRAVYDEEYERSIIDCMREGTEACEMMLKSHRLHVATLTRNASLSTFLKLLREMKPGVVGGPERAARKVDEGNDEGSGSDASSIDSVELD